MIIFFVCFPPASVTIRKVDRFGILVSLSSFLLFVVAVVVLLSMFGFNQIGGLN